MTLVTFYWYRARGRTSRADTSSPGELLRVVLFACVLEGYTPERVEARVVRLAMLIVYWLRMH
jgi:hypothetical protein